MSINEIQESGLLELYAMGALSGSELTQVEQALRQYPQLKGDLNNIERTLQTYATAHSVMPSPGLKAQILQEARNSQPPSNNNNTSKKKDSGRDYDLLKGLLALLSMLSLFLAYNWYMSNQQTSQIEERYRAEIQDCDSIQDASARQYALYQDLTNPNNQIIGNSEHPKYNETEIYFYHNPVDKKNYLQLADLPPIDNNTQSYQLWSIIGDNPPQPLNVFQSDGEIVIPVQHIEGTQVYAITIERKGGVASPTMDDLIGTFTI